MEIINGMEDLIRSGFAKPPQIAIIAKGNMDLFWEVLDQRLELCKKHLQ